MSISIIRGEDASILVRLKTAGTEDPFDLAGVELVQACFLNTEGESFFKQYLPLTGDTTSASDLISNIETDDIKEGQPISGSGIPAGATVLKTPASEETPTAAGTIQISANATLTAVGVSLLFGDIQLQTPLAWGKFLITFDEDDTNALGNEDFEVLVRTGGVTKYKIFTGAFIINDRIC